MPKKLDTNFKFTTSTKTTCTASPDGPEWYYEGTTTSPYPYMWHGIYPPYSYDCPYKLPCGKCRLTMQFCSGGGNWEKWEITCNSNTDK